MPTNRCGDAGGCSSLLSSPASSAKTFEPSTLSTTLGLRDILGGWAARWGIGRMRYTVEPGLYQVGSPGRGSPVLVTSNYKLTVDALRKELEGVDAWILVLDTSGVNVWCAAGKGTFGTEELLLRLAATDLASRIDHRRLILPQLGATGVSAPEAMKRSGWSVVWGPVLASDIKAFLAAGLRKTEAMRTIRFGMWDRLVLAPMELVQAAKWSPLLAAFAFLAALPLGSGFSARLWGGGVVLGSSVIAGAVLFPALLPWLPFRAFGLKGLALGLPFVALLGTAAVHGLGTPPLLLVEIGLPAIALVVWLAMNFTGASTYTGQTGATLEVRVGLPLVLGATGLGLLLCIARIGFSLI